MCSYALGYGCVFTIGHRMSHPSVFETGPYLFSVIRLGVARSLAVSTSNLQLLNHLVTQSLWLLLLCLEGRGVGPFRA